ncbi:MAG: hypothetical protein PUB10_06585 [Clostridiales bacterium]|nr:hypothetical protein [Clostridiales bacterium]
MEKWYEEAGEESDVVIASKVSLARNVAGVHFTNRQTDEESAKLLDLVLDKMSNYGDDGGNYDASPISELREVDRASLMERHLASPLLIQKKNTGILIPDDESASIMVGEEDHLRMQVLKSGMNLEEAYTRVNDMDDYADEVLGLAFHPKFGYLTASPVNAGTGLHASFLVYLPALSASGKIPQLSQEVSRYGVNLHGVYGENQKTYADIFQMTNQKTLGCNEYELMEMMNGMVQQIIRQERKYREYALNQNYDQIADQIYRSYGVLKYARQLTTKDAVTLLTQIKLGVDTGILTLEEDKNIYSLIMDIQPNNLQFIAGANLGNQQRDQMRAEYISDNLPELAED